MSRPRLAFFLSHPIQYISPLLKELDQKFDLHAYYFSDASVRGQLDKGFGQVVKWDRPLLDGYDYTFIKNYSRSKTVSNRFFELFNPGLIKHLHKEKADIIVVNGWSYFSVILTIIMAKLVGKKVWLRAENPLHHEFRKSRKTLLLKKMFLKYGLFRLVDKFLYIGTKNKEFFKYYGVNDHQLIFTPYSVDNSFFNRQYIEYRKSKSELFKELNLTPGKKVILFSGKYIEQKRPLDLIRAYHLMRHRRNTVLVMMGEGELRPAMEAYIAKHQLNDVILTGFINQSAISRFYAVADVFVMCSGIPETWGLSVNEAMNFAVPVVVSRTCGSSYDLVKDDQNGFTFEEGDVVTLASRLDFIVSNEEFAKKAGSLSKEIVSKYNYEVVVNNMYKVLQIPRIHEN